MDVLLAKQLGSAVFTDTAESLPDRLDQGQWNSSTPKKASPTPSPELLGALKAGGGVSAIKMCANVRVFLDRKGVLYGSRAVAEATAIEKDGNFHATVLGVSMPVISHDGAYALLASSAVSAPEAGGGFLQYLQHQTTGKWIPVDWSPLWIS